MISGCGYACDECWLKEANKCPGCGPENEIAQKCPIILCLKEKALEHCLKCADRYKEATVCETYSNSLRHCPLRFHVLGIK